MSMWLSLYAVDEARVDAACKQGPDAAGGDYDEFSPGQDFMWLFGVFADESGHPSGLVWAGDTRPAPGIGGYTGAMVVPAAVVAERAQRLAALTDDDLQRRLGSPSPAGAGLAAELAVLAGLMESYDDDPDDDRVGTARELIEFFQHAARDRRAIIAVVE